jgi:MFS superfamily sulfate permease-like transporter
MSYPDGVKLLYYHETKKSAKSLPLILLRWWNIRESSKPRPQSPTISHSTYDSSLLVIARHSLLILGICLVLSLLVSSIGHPTTHHPTCLSLIKDSSSLFSLSSSLLHFTHPHFHFHQASSKQRQLPASTLIKTLRSLLHTNSHHADLRQDL